jgi:hypothetical protein
MTKSKVLNIIVEGPTVPANKDYGKERPIRES